MPNDELLQELLDYFHEFNSSFELNSTDYRETDLEQLLRHIERTSLPGSDSETSPVPHDFPVVYRIVATALHVVIFLVGVLGNIVLIIAALKSKKLRTPTYAYLVSLAFADLLVLCTAVPEAVVNHHVGKRWIFGSSACALHVFLSFVGINVGSLSIMTFAFERYIAICHPLFSYRLRTIRRTRKIIFAKWIFVFLYCSPWLTLTGLKTESNGRQQCSFLLSRDQYSALFITDLAIFYLLPLSTAFLCYVSVAFTVTRQKAVRRSFSRSGSTCTIKSVEWRTGESGTHEVYRRRRPSQTKGGSVPSKKRVLSISTSVAAAAALVVVLAIQDKAYLSTMMMSLNKVNQMLTVVVILFAISWLPFRSLLVYNSFATRSWLNIWFLLFAKTLIYLNSAINPMLYNAMSDRFRQAVRETFPRLLKSGTLQRTGTFQSARSEVQNSVSYVNNRRLTRHPSIVYL